jgi:hypothetical protein
MEFMYYYAKGNNCIDDINDYAKGNNCIDDINVLEINYGVTSTLAGMPTEFVLKASWLFIKRQYKPTPSKRSTAKVRISICSFPLDESKTEKALVSTPSTVHN